MLRAIAFGTLGVLSSICLMFGAYVVSSLDAIPITNHVADYPQAFWLGVSFTMIGFLGLSATLLATQD